MRQIIRTPDAPSSPLFSQAIKVGSTLYVSGMAGIDPKTNQLAGSPIQEQARQALLNCQNILRAADATLDDVVWMASVQTTSKGLALALAVQPLESWRETLAVS
jgi:enamine deaminase RidA (YjgF/YER057c/UK114 family)